MEFTEWFKIVKGYRDISETVEWRPDLQIPGVTEDIVALMVLIEPVMLAMMAYTSTGLKCKWFRKTISKAYVHQPLLVIHRGYDGHVTAVGSVFFLGRYVDSTGNEITGISRFL